MRHEHKKPKEQLRAYSELAATEGKGHGLGPPAIDSGFHGPVASAVGERQHSGSGQRSWCGKSQTNVGRLGTGWSIRSGTSLQAVLNKWSLQHQYIRATLVNVEIQREMSHCC